MSASKIVKAGNNVSPRISIRRRIRVREKGMTTVGFLIIGVFVGLFAFGAIRLMPVYLNYLKVAGVLDGVYDEFDSQAATRGELRKSVVRRFEIESVSMITSKDIKITGEDGGFMVEAKYDHPAPFIANVNFLVSFDKTVHVRR